MLRMSTIKNAMLSLITVYITFTCIPMVLQAQIGRGDYISPPAWSPDGHSIAFIINTSVEIRKVDTNRVIGILKGHTSFVSMVRWSPDGAMIAAPSDDQTFKVWQVSDGELLQSLTAQNDIITAVAWSPDGTRLISGNFDVRPNLFVWDTHLWKPISTHTAGTITDVAFSSDGGRIAYTAPGGIEVLDGNTLQSIAIYRNPPCCSNENYSIAWSRDGNRLVTGSREGTVTIWDASNATILKQFDGNNNRRAGNTLLSWVRDVTFSPDGSTVLAISGDGTLREWSVVTGAVVQDTSVGILYSASWSPYSGRLAILAPQNAQETAALNDAKTFDASKVTGELKVIVPTPLLGRLQSIAAACHAPTTITQLLVSPGVTQQLPTFITRINALPVGTIPPACNADLVAIAQALQK